MIARNALIKMAARAALMGCFLLMTTMASAGVLIVGGNYDDDPEDPFGATIRAQGSPPVDFLENFSDMIFEPREVAVGPNGNFFVLEGAETGDVATGVPTGLVHEFSRQGEYIGEFIAQSALGDNDESKFMAFRPDGYLYIGTEDGEVRRYDASTGAYFDTIIETGDGDTDSEINETGAMTFDPAGNIYLAGSFSGAASYNDAVLKFDSSGNFLSVVIDDSNDPYDESHGLAWQDGRLYVANDDTHNILVVSFNPDGSTDSVDEFVSVRSGGLDEPYRIAFGPDGLLYVVAAGGEGGEGDFPEDEMLFRYNGTTGAFVDKFAGRSSPTAITNDPFSFIFVFTEEPVPLLDDWAIALLVALMLAGGGWVLMRRNRVTPA